MFYSGIGGQVDFVRGASRSQGGKAIIALPSTAEDETLSRIVPTLKEGAGVVTSRGDVHYVVTEFGTAYLHGKSIRERAMALISIAHPKFRPWLMAEAKNRRMIYRDQVEPRISAPAYPFELEGWIDLEGGERVFLRPLRITDEALLRGLFYSLSPEAVYHRFFSHLKSMPHEKIQDFLAIDYESDMALVVTNGDSEDEVGLAVGRYMRNPASNLAEVAFLVRDDWQNKGLGKTLLGKLKDVATAHAIAGFTADVLSDNRSMMHVFHRAGFAIESKLEDGVYSLTMSFPDTPPQTHQKR
jgi:GNAT superfamily N-acetyltransferase